jgi:hypothetical protein
VLDRSIVLTTCDSDASGDDKVLGELEEQFCAAAGASDESGGGSDGGTGHGIMGVDVKL